MTILHTFLVVGFLSVVALSQSQSIDQAVRDVIPHPYVEWNDPGDLVYDYCGIILGRGLEDFSSHFTRQIFRGDPVADLFLRGFTVVGGNEWRYRLLNDLDYFTSDDFDWRDDIGTTLSIFWICFASFAILLFIIAIVMMPGCCSSVWRNCLGWIFCKQCCHDRERVRPITEIKKWKRRFLWIGGLTGIIALLLVTLLALAFSIKFFWTPGGALCQVGRIYQEFEHGIIYDQSGSESSWLTNLPAGATWMGMSGLGDRLTELIPDEVKDQVMDQIDSFIREATEFLDVVRDALTDAADTLSKDWVYRVITLSAIPLVAISALILVGAVFVIVMLVLLNRHYKRGTEPKFKAYSNWFAFFWGWFAITGAFLLLFGISILTPLSPTSAVCRTIRGAADDLTILKEYKVTNGWLEEDNMRIVLESCLSNSGEGLWFEEVDGLQEILGMMNDQLDEIPGIDITVDISDLGLNCKPLGFSIGSLIDGVCGGIQQDLFWIGLSWCLAAGVSFWFWMMSYKLFHYFKERARRAKKDEEVIATEPLKPSPSALVALAKQRENEELARQLQTVDPQTFRQDAHANTTLHVAAYSGDLEMCERLVLRNAPLDELNKFGFTPMAVAASEGHSHVVAYLIRKGADPTIQDQFGESPLHAAARAGDLAVVEALCQDCAPAPIYTNDEGEVAVDIAAFGGHTNVEAYLDPRTPKTHRTIKSFGFSSD